MTAPKFQPEVTIRPFNAADYQRIAEIEHANFPKHPQTADEFRFYDEKRDAKFVFARFVAEDPDSGDVIAVANYGQHPWMYHPRKFGVWVCVDPRYQGRGIGTLLYDHLLRELEPYEPITLRLHEQEDQTRGMTFLKSRGFEETMREWESRLVVADFDPAPFAAAAARVADQGIVIKTLRELESDPNRDRKLYDLDANVSLDMPSSGPSSFPAYDEWYKHTFENPNLLPDAYFVAVDTTQEDHYVALSQLWKMQGAPDLDTGATGVRREYRKRGIAMALKLRAVAYAQETGAPCIRTWNAQSNRPMLGINEALGFAKEPAWIEFQCKLRDEPIPIRHATPNDYDGLADLLNAVYPEFPVTAFELKHQDQNRAPKMRHDRFALDQDGKMVAYGQYSQSPGSYDPKKFELEIAVLPEYQGRGYGKALYEHLLAALRPFDPELVTTWIISNRERALRFLADRGFAETIREQASKYDPTDFDSAEYAADLERVAAQGIVVRTFAELKESDPDVYTKLEELSWQVVQDIPHPEPVTRPDFDQWMKRFDGPRFLPEGNFIAVDTATGAYVGTSQLWGPQGTTDLHTGMTGVLPTYRKRGIATAMKVRALQFAKERGSTAVWTANEVNNNGMLGINFRLGFVEQPVEIGFAKKLKTDA